MGGSGSVNIAINLDRANPFFFGGEMVSGRVDLNVNQGEIKAEEIFLTLTGEIGYTTTRTVSTGKGQTQTRTEYHHVPFFLVKIPFARPQTGDKELIYGLGQYSWPFQIPVTDYLPPTINQPQSYPHVRYYLQFVIDKSWYKANTRETRYLTVFPRVNLLENPQCLMRTIFGNQNRKEITLKGTLNKLGYVPGETIIANLEIQNPRRVLIKSLDLSMIECHRIGCNTRGSSVFRITLPNIINRNDERISEVFAVVIPGIPLAPSYQFHGGLQRAAFVQISYSLKFEVKVEGMFTNFDVTVPITLGTEPNPLPIEQQGISPLTVSYSSNPEQSMFKDDDPPPDYHSVVQNTK